MNRAETIDPAALPREWVDEIPTRPSRFKATTVSLAASMLVILGALMWLHGSRGFLSFMSRHGAIADLFNSSGLIDYILLAFPVFGLVGAGCLIGGVLSLVRTRATYALLRSVLLVIYPVVVAYVAIAWVGVSAIEDERLLVDGAKLDSVTALKLWWQVSWPALAIALYAAWLHLLLASRSVYAAFTGRQGEAMEGDRVLEDLRTHGREPRARRSLYKSVVAHIIVLIAIPYLLQAQGCVEAYRVPKGSGQAQLVVAMKKVKKKKKRKKLLLRKNSAFIFAIPDLFEPTEIDKLMDEHSQETYVANATPGKLGKGGGTKGGWPEGMEDAKVRFIRLDHGGRGWDDGMRESGADANFLRHFYKLTGLKVKRNGESHKISLLRKYPDDGFPPFVFLTGNHHMGRISKSDVEILRKYCLKGGMLFADAGSNTFDRSFRGFIRRVFPGKPLIDIADDDPLFQQPTRFPNGAPSFWHHGGSRAMGIKHEGRWIVFYHPGDMNDAWKNAGYSDVTPEMRHNAMQLGINIVFYAFNQWNDAVARLRK